MNEWVKWADFSFRCTFNGFLFSITADSRFSPLQGKTQVLTSRTIVTLLSKSANDSRERWRELWLLSNQQWVRLIRSFSICCGVCVRAQKEVNGFRIDKRVWRCVCAWTSHTKIWMDSVVRICWLCNRSAMFLFSYFMRAKWKHEGKIIVNFRLRRRLSSLCRPTAMRNILRQPKHARRVAIWLCDFRSLLFRVQSINLVLSGMLDIAYEHLRL